ncbi:MAG: MFS transporter [Rickettsiales bacterium]|nr:MFS transporter [Rickettsiales bacterium]
MTPIKKSQIFFLSFLALPLAFVGIPIYLNISDFYAQKFQLSLTLIGILLIFIRVVDALQDPLIGYFSDYLARKKISRQKIISVSALFLVLSFYLVFNPPLFLNKNLAITWFFITLIFTYSFFNFTIINFEALIAIIAKDDRERIIINSCKEFLGLIGMILAFILPTILVQNLAQSDQQNYHVLSLTFAVLIVLAVLFFLPKIQIDNENLSQKISASFSKKITFLAVWRDQKFLFFLLIFLVNSIAVSLPAANLNFYIREVLNSEKNLGWFLSIYFLSACFFIPIWKILFNKIGVIKLWILSISFSVLTFFLAYFLDNQTWQYFYFVCFFSGIFLGCDLIAPPIILAQIISSKKELASSYFSMWNLVAKLGLMIAASTSLIVLGFFGYQPENWSQNLAWRDLNLIAFFYALLPCILKIITILLLKKWQKLSIQESF